MTTQEADEFRVAAMTAAKLVGDTFIAVPMNPVSWGWCVLNIETLEYANGCSTRESSERVASKMNQRARI